MEEQKIKEAIRQQLETAEINPYLKNKTMDYITRKSRKKNHNYQQIKKISLTAMTFATVMLMMIIQNKNSNPTEPEYLSDDLPMALSVDDGAEISRSMMIETPFSQFKTTLNELGVQYTEEAAFVSEGTTIYSLLINGVTSYYLELSTDTQNEEICSLTTYVLGQTNHTPNSYHVISLDEQSLFLYGGGDKKLLEELQMIANEIICSN